MYKAFGIFALVGLGFYWLTERSADASPRKLTASWYGDECAGKLMTNGRPFDPDKFTCASWDYPLGTRLKISRGPIWVVAAVTDRGPARRLLRTRQIDLSRAAFLWLSPLEAGLIKVTVEVFK